MSFSRRLAAGLPAAGVTVFAALAFAGAPATAAEPAVEGGYPAVMTSPEPTADTRGNAGYGGDVAEVPPATATPTDTADDTPTRGNPGYRPTTPPPTTTTPPGELPETPTGVQSEAVPEESPDDITPAGVSGGNLPLTGAPLTGTLALGGLMVAAGGAAVWYTRRRRTA